ncbi:hypothetical protein OH76DRAFT_1189873 [Lentinus brumalis]|uniref:Uncharacterized protein n=1 Tax=Lentinus brumalis TaxID=2498619 RepID=A0A371CTI1_9APHY|nr:hypothetical protein OH76DRAFT_1189873 [Polyporus brumalis]
MSQLRARPRDCSLLPSSRTELPSLSKAHSIQPRSMRDAIGSPTLFARGFSSTDGTLARLVGAPITRNARRRPRVTAFCEDDRWAVATLAQSRRALVSSGTSKPSELPLASPCSNGPRALTRG